MVHAFMQGLCPSMVCTSTQLVTVFQLACAHVVTSRMALLVYISSCVLLLRRQLQRHPYRGGPNSSAATHTPTISSQAIRVKGNRLQGRNKQGSICASHSSSSSSTCSASC